MLGGDTVDHLGDEHRLAHAGTAEEANLSALHVRLKQVDDLDAGLEHRRLRLERVKRRRGAVDLPPIRDAFAQIGTVERLAEHVEDVAEHAVADRHADALAGVRHRHASGQSVGGLHRNDAHPVVADLLGHLAGDGDGCAFELDMHLDGGVDLGERPRRELRIDDRPGDGHDASIGEIGRLVGCACFGQSH